MSLKIILWLLGGGSYIVAGLFVSGIIMFDRGDQGTHPGYGPLSQKLLNLNINKDILAAAVALFWPLSLASKLLKF